MKSSTVTAAHEQPKKKLPSWILNLQFHLEHTFDLWNVKNPDHKTRLIRSLIFISCLLLTIYWPIPDLLINLFLLVIAWSVLCLTDKPVWRFLLMLLNMLSLTWLYHIMKIIIPQF
jgi:hypothetical protein